MKMLSFDTDTDFAQNYKFLIGSIIPRPIAAVSTLNLDGTNNLAPFSFFNGVCSKPMIVSFCPVIRTSTGMKKDTLINIEREKEFVINFVTEEIAEKINLASTELKYGEDEFLYSKLTPIKSQKIKAMRVQESPIHFECQLRDILSYGDGKSAGSGYLVTGEVIKVHINEAIYQDGRIITDLYKAVGRGAGNDWIKTDSRTQFERLMKAQIQK
mgnify:CR=1 FL=1